MQSVESAHGVPVNQARAVFKEAFTKAGLPYFNPHSFRSTIVQLGQLKCKTPEAFKAWSQNLGHESVLTTLYSYGEVGKQRQSDILKDLKSDVHDKQTTESDLADAIAQRLIHHGIKAGDMAKMA